MNVLHSAQTLLQAAYDRALAYPLESVARIGLSRSSSRVEVELAFKKVYTIKNPTGLDSPFGRERLEKGVDLFMSKRQIPGFVARYVAGIILLEQKSPP